MRDRTTAALATLVLASAGCIQRMGEEVEEPRVRWGTGTLATGFSPLEEGDEVGLELGPEGLHMYVLALRARGLSLGRCPPDGYGPTLNLWAEVLVDERFLANLEMLLDKPEDKPHALTPEVVESMRAREGDFVGSAGWYGHPEWEELDDGWFEQLGIRAIADLDAQYLYGTRTTFHLELLDGCGRTVDSELTCRSVCAEGMPGRCGHEEGCCFVAGAYRPRGCCRDVLGG